MPTSTKLHGRQIKVSSLPRSVVDQDFQDFLLSLATKTEVDTARTETTVTASNGLEKDIAGNLTVKVGTLLAIGQDNQLILKTDNLFKRGVPAGAIDGVNKVFQYSENFASNSESLILNGIELQVNEDYTIDYGKGEITLLEPPQIGDRMWIRGAVVEV